MKSLAALAFIAASAIALPAYAQGGGPFSQVGGPFDGAASQFGRPALQTFDPSAPNPDWRACTNDEYRYSIDDVTAGCTRVIDRASNFEERA